MIDANADPPAEMLSLAQIAAEKQVTVQQVGRWVNHGIRVGGRRVRLNPTEVVGNRTRVSRADLDLFLAECRAAKFGDRPAATETPTAEARRGQRAKDRLARKLAGVS